MDPEDPNAALRARAELLTRFADIRAYFQERGITSYMPVFQAIDPELEAHAADIRQWWSREAASLKAEDVPVIEKMEGVVKHLKAA